MSPSFRDIWQRLPRGLLGALAAAAACESYIAANDLKFSRQVPDDWRQAGRAASVDRPAGGVLFFGDSQVKFGFSPLTIEARLGQPAQSMAIMGGQAPTSFLLLRRALESGAMPSAVVVDFEPHLLRDKLPDVARMSAELADLRDIAELAWDAGDSDAFAAMTLGRALPSYRQRLEIRDNLMAALRGETPMVGEAMEYCRRNRAMNRGGAVLSRNPAPKVHDVTPWGNPAPAPWAPSRINELYTKKFLGLAREHNIPVYCALMPTDPTLLIKRVACGMEGRYIGWLHWLQGQYPNLYVLDWRHAKYQPTVFMDALHLNVDGVTSISVALGDYLRRSARGEGVDVRWVSMPEFKLDGTEVAVEDLGQSGVVMRSSAARRRR